MAENFPSRYDEEDFRAFDEEGAGKSKLSRMREGGKIAWSERNNLSAEGKQKEEELIEALQDFQNATGIDEQKYIEQLKKCKSDWEVQKLEKKFKKAGTKWYEIQMLRSGLFEPLDVREEKLMSEERKGLLDWFSHLPLYGDLSMISTLKTLDQDLQVKRRFRDKLKKQSKFVQSEYFRRLGSLPLVGSREQLLENVLKELKEVEDAPSAVQYEFKKKQKGASAGRATAEIKKEVMQEYRNRFEAYKKMVLDHKAVFGGDPVMTALGKLPEAAWEFIEWFTERENFAEIEDGLKKLPGLIKKRQKLLDKRDAILKNALPKDREKLEQKTGRMRRHELEKFLPELEQEIRKKSVHVAEYMATILSARAQNVDLYQALERSLLINKFKLANFETQKAKLVVLREEIEDRAHVVNEYFSLPSYLRNDKAFLAANAIDREAFLMEAKEQRNREQKEPFDASHIEDLDSEDLEETQKKLKGKQGEAVMEEILEEMEGEGRLAAAEVQEATYQKIFGAATRAKKFEGETKETQKASYLDDLKFWIRLRKDVKSETDVQTERERSKWRYIRAADEAYELGYTMTSGGQVRELQEITATDLKEGNALTKEKLHRARYGEHVMVRDHEGEMARDPLEIIERLSTEELIKLVLLALNKLGKGYMHLSDSNVTVLMNSPNIRKEMAARIIDLEMSHLTMDTKNTDHFISKAAA